MLTIGQDIISGNMGYIGTEPGRLYRMGPQSKVAEASGEPPMVLADCKKKPLKGLRIYGKSKQVTTTGAQLISAKTDATEINGITYSSEYGKVTLDGIASADTTISIPSAVKLEEGKTYTISSTSLVGVNNVAIYSSIITLDSTAKTAMATGTGTPGILIYIASGTTYHNDELCVMVEEGSTAHPYEPYTGGKPSPSPDYPQEIESVGTKWSTGANLVDVHNAIKINTYGLEITVKDDGTIVISGTSSSNAKKLSFTFLDNKFSFPLTSIFKCFDVEEKNCKLSSVRRTKSDATDNRIAIDINQINSGNPIYCSFKLVVSEKAVEEYEPYTGGVQKPYGDKIGVNVRGKNLIPFPYPELGGAGAQTEKEGVKYTVQGDGGIRCTGTPSSQFGVIITRIAYSATALSSSNPSNGKIVLSGGELYFDPKNNALFIYYNPSQVDKPLDTVFYPQIELGTVATPYEPYREPQSMSISVPNGLPGIQVASGGNYTDADGRQWICDEVDFARGVYVQRVWKGVFDGSDDERWEIYNNTTYAGFYLTNVFAEKLTMRDGIANTYKVDNSYIPIEAVWIGVNEKAIYIKNSRFYDDTLSDKGLSNFKDSLAAHPMVVMTYLDSPIETPLTDDQLAAYKALHTYKDTYKGTTIIDNDAGAYMTIKYNT